VTREKYNDERSRKDITIYKLCNGKKVQVDCEHKSDTTNNIDHWKHLNNIKKLSVIDARKSRHQGTIENGAHALRYVVYCFKDKIYFGMYYLLY